MRGKEGAEVLTFLNLRCYVWPGMRGGVGKEREGRRCDQERGVRIARRENSGEPKAGVKNGRGKEGAKKRKKEEKRGN